MEKVISKEIEYGSREARIKRADERSAQILKRLQMQKEHIKEVSTRMRKLLFDMLPIVESDLLSKGYAVLVRRVHDLENPPICLYDSMMLTPTFMGVLFRENLFEKYREELKGCWQREEEDRV